jgi:DNA-binding NtrC family response regulator
VRELRNAIQRGVLLTDGTCIDAAALQLSPVASASGGRRGNAESAGEPDRGDIEAALGRSEGVIARAASELGLSRQALYRRMEKLGIDRI